MLSFTEAAERLVEDRIAPNMTAEGLRRLARDPKSGWPIGPGDYRVVGKTRTLPYDVLAEYMRERLGKRRGRGPDTKKRSPRPKQGEPVSHTVDPRIAILSDLNDPPYNATAEKRCVPWDEAVKMLAAYRAAELRDFLWRLEQSSGDAVAAKLVEDNPDLAELLNATETEGA
ncbi:hypothetical protein IQ64_07490 [Streptomyces stelliscabiei]|nr:hypothetical protein IQ64_07490 [Streptomyces stelliscabiei]